MNILLSIFLSFAQRHIILIWSNERRNAEGNRIDPIRANRISNSCLPFSAGVYMPQNLTFKMAVGEYKQERI